MAPTAANKMHKHAADADSVIADGGAASAPLLRAADAALRLLAAAPVAVTQVDEARSVVY